MKRPEETKLIPRNAPALRKSANANPQPRLNAGNPISTRLESGIGNCFPGLECDLRNLERRFFPFLEVDFEDPDVPGEISVASVDILGVLAARAAGKLSAAATAVYEKIAVGKWKIRTLKGEFGLLGKLNLTLETLSSLSTGKRRRPVDPWTAVRLLTEGTQVTLGLAHAGRGTERAALKLVGLRQSYIGDDGALSAFFQPGEMTQSLCSPWTHDFRDCACYYWASNHPDIAMPPLPSTPTDDPKWDRPVAWERANRTQDKLPNPASVRDPTNIELKHFEINRRWQELNFVIERREQVGPYLQRKFYAKPLAGRQELITHLRYAAGVELAVLQEYLAAAYSLKPDRAMSGRLRDDVRAARAEVMRIAIAEMNHLRAVNSILASLQERAYRPALGVAKKIPGKGRGAFVPVKISPMSRDAVKRFINIEAPSQSVDGVYSRILATLEQGGRNEDIQSISNVMAEGEDHYRTFRAIQEWLKEHKEKDYLRKKNLPRPPKGNAAHRNLQTLYGKLLDLLYKGYAAGLPDGAHWLNEARTKMVQVGSIATTGIAPASIATAAEAVADAGFLVVFETPADKRFAEVDHP